MKYLKISILSLLLIFSVGIGTSAADNFTHSLPSLTIRASFVGAACSGLQQISTTGCVASTNPLKTITRKVVTVLSLIIGSVAIIMIIISGFKFVTAAGDSNGVSSARNTLMYAAIGLLIAVLAQLIVHFALNTANSINTGYQRSAYSRNYV